MVALPAMRVGETMTDKGYQGWTNYETWNLALWLDNDHRQYDYWREVAQNCLKGAKDRDDAVDALAAILRDEVEDKGPDVSGFYADVLNAAIAKVNWHEIAETWIDREQEG